ncbi:facilitated trehalose transporter Tret1 isoform X2 [Drosophila mojavensis]|uniref:facilitated trehalose transporter Tret1 isoform X2 n=1 Tax=Drosophila mojavensis TaxID=7230 RepID=UPI001CD14E5E|nr:facilitated trehalose transporter Tret1 isoform X2 [Drosophila mojavensis]XP_015022847.2 facilitated trehalose transporter Tret1 isoform X2 [Drosophila mojavensis]XP_032584200.2 facilitated trehalose transporter Tret1 isoform X2 [Drosophila mojavensis]XP_043864222.1 facilitated trehalose transporter Tret1 isoform X2 [Drosophila mojavensis]
MSNGKAAVSADKNGALNDRPLFMHNGNNNNNRRISGVIDVEVSNFRRALPQFLAVSIKNLLLFGYGMTLGFPTIVIPAIQGGEGRREGSDSGIVLNKEEISWFSSINLICVPLGCLFSGLLTQPLGKRRAMQFVNLPILAAWLMFHFATRTEHLYAALCLAGLGGGLMEAPVLTYVAEITEPRYRGILSALGTTCVITGVFVQFILGSLMDWRSVAAVSAAFPVITIVMLCFVPESPIWLIREERYREAVKSLQWLRGWVPEHQVETEFNRLYDELVTQKAIEEATEGSGALPGQRRTLKHRLRMWRKRTFLVPFMLVSFTFFTGHFSGKTPLQTYAVQIFHTLKAPMNKYHATILLGVAEMLSTILGVALIHFTGKRPLVLISTVGTGLCFLGTATYAHFLNDVPGFAVNNVVVNASAIVPKGSIISQANISKIFENQYQDELVHQHQLQQEREHEHELEQQLTTMLQELDTTTIEQFDTTMEPWNRIKRELDTTLSPHNVDESEVTTLLPEPAAAAPVGVSSEVPPSKPPISEDLLLTVPKQERNYLVWVPLILLLLSAFFSHLGIRMIPWILIGEVFPADIRNMASGFAGGVGYVFGFLANKLFLLMLSTLTLPGTFAFYASVAFIGAVVLYYTLPETEGRTLAEIEAHFSKKSDMNLLRKQPPQHATEKQQSPPVNGANAIQLDNLQDLHMPVSQLQQAKIIKLQQSDFVPAAQPERPTDRGAALAGVSNPAFEETNNTTHL